MKQGLIAVALASILLLTGCSTGGLSKSNENAFVEGNGVALYLQPSQRKPAPLISGATLADGKMNLSYDKVTVLNVWASWCAPCRAEAPLLSDFATTYKSRGVQFAGILTRDNLGSALEFVKRFKIDYPTFTDDSVLAGFRNSLVPNAIPTTLIIDAHGDVAARISGEVTVALLTNVLDKVLKESAHA